MTFRWWVDQDQSAYTFCRPDSGSKVAPGSFACNGQTLSSGLWLAQVHLFYLRRSCARVCAETVSGSHLRSAGLCTRCLDLCKSNPGLLHAASFECQGKRSCIVPRLFPSFPSGRSPQGWPWLYSRTERNHRSLGGLRSQPSAPNPALPISYGLDPGTKVSGWESLKIHSGTVYHYHTLLTF